MVTAVAACAALNALPLRAAAAPGHGGHVAILGRMKKTFRSLLCVPAACAVLLVLSACGNKGPLVMPQKPVPIEEQVVEPASDAVDGPVEQKGQDGQDDAADPRAEPAAADGRGNG